ncbi:hypothetical protein [Acuticoccus sp.]|uniref:hypothetical protein n=1 Tax=Acuticoccus sp. TaxID=1904378 RepID=UPI003B52B830
MRGRRWRARALGLATALTLGGCVGLHRGEPATWFDAVDAVAPRDGGRVVVCHGFGCRRKTAVVFTSRDVATMRGIVGAASSASAERAGIRRLVAWAERRVAPEVGSTRDVGGLDLWNAGERGQMDCIDEATNTTSYLLVAERAGLLRHHRVGRPVSRGYFLDGRYPHATAVVVAGDAAWAVDSWPHANGVPPDVLPLPVWSARGPMR